MSGLGLLLRLRLQAAWGAVRFTRGAARWVGLGLSLSGIALAVALFFLYGTLLSGARAQGEETLHQLVSRTIWFLFLFLLGSAVPFVSSTLFAPGDLFLLRATPIPPAPVVVGRLLDATIAASAQFVVIGVPLLVACAAALHIPYWGWAVFLLLLLLFLLLPALFVAALLFLLARLTGIRRVRTVVAVVSAVVALGMCLLVVAEFTGQASRISERGLSGLKGSGEGAPLLPPMVWAAKTLIALGSPRPAAGALPPLLALAGVTLALGMVSVALGRSILMGEALLEGEGSGPTVGRPSLLDRLLAALPISPPFRALLGKDLRYVVRDLVLLSQIGIPAILYFVPFVIAGQMARQGASRNDLFGLSAGMVAVIVYMETSILSLSSIGLEGRAFWLLRSAPVSAGLLVRAKFAIASGLSVGLAAPLWLLACLVYRVPVAWMLYGGSALLVSCGALCGFGVGIAGLFPRFLYDNPAHRASLAALVWGFVGATVYVLLSVPLLTVGLLSAQFWPERAALVAAITAAIYVLASLLMVVIPLLLARRRLESYAWEH